MVGHLFNTLTEFLCYFAPAFIALGRKSQGKDVVLPSIGQFFLYNLLIAWTVVGWFLLLAMAFGKNPVPMMVKVFVGKKALEQGFAPPSPQGPWRGPSSSMVTCYTCGGSGSVSCSTCQGRGSWYTQPTTANGTSQLQTCSACGSSGRLRCMGCDGSGRVPGPIG